MLKKNKKDIPVFRSLASKKLVDILKRDGVGVLATDTLYGLVGRALSKQAVERIYSLKERASSKPCIVLIASLDDLAMLSIRVNKRIEGPFRGLLVKGVSVIVPCRSKKLQYIHRGTQTLAVRIPKKKELVRLIGEVGPLVAPSANREGDRPAHTQKKAQDYFGDTVDFYIDQGTKEGKPSTLARIDDGKLEILRQGPVKINSL